MGGSVSGRPPQTAFSRAGTVGRMASWLAPEGQWNAGRSEHWEKKGRKQGRSHLSCDPVLSQGLEREDVLWFPKQCFDCTVGNESKQRPTAIRQAMRRLSPQSVGRDLAFQMEKPCRPEAYRVLSLTFVLLEYSHSWLHCEMCVCGVLSLFSKWGCWSWGVQQSHRVTQSGHADATPSESLLKGQCSWVA